MIQIIWYRLWYRYGTEYDRSGNPKSSFHGGSDIWNLLFLYVFVFYFSMESISWDWFDRATCWSLFLIFFFFEILSNSLQESDVLLFLEAIYMVSNLLYYFIEFTLLLHTFLVISFLIKTIYNLVDFIQ